MVGNGGLDARAKSIMCDATDQSLREISVLAHWVLLPCLKDFPFGLNAAGDDYIHKEVGMSTERVSVPIYTWKSTCPTFAGAQLRRLFPCCCVWRNSLCLPSYLQLQLRST